MIAQPRRVLGTVSAAALALALAMGVLVAAAPKAGLAVLAAGAYASLAAIGFAAIFAAWMISFFIPFYAIGNVLLKAGLLLAAFGLIVTVARHASEIGARLRAASPFLAVAAAMLAWFAASALWAPEADTAISELWKFGISVAIFAALAIVIDTKRLVRLIVAAFIVGALITGISALLGVSGGPVNSLPSEGRLQGGTGDPNVLAAAVIAGIALSAGLLKGTRRPTPRLALLATFFVFGLTAAGTGSRGGTVAALAALLAALAVMRGERRAVVGLALSVLVAGAAWLTFSEGSLHRLTSFGDRGDGRNDLWRIAWEMFTHHPLQGVGLQNFIPLAPRYVLHPGALTFIHLITEKPVVVHNTYLQFLTETGVVGLLLFLIVVSLSLCAALRAAHIHEVAGDLAFAHLCRCVFVAAVTLLASSFFISAGVDYKLWAILGLGPAMLIIGQRGEAPRSSVTAVRAPGAPPAGALASAARVAVIVPFFNDGETIEGTLASLEGQEHCEVIVIDDGSDDPHSLAALARLRAAGIKVISQPNRGLSAARMRGVQETAAPYIQPLDADDFLAPDAIRRLADMLDADPELGVAWGDQRTFGEVELTQKRTATLDPWAITYVNRLTAGMIRRQALLEAGGWVLEIGYEDWDLWMGLAEGGWKGRRLDATTYVYRISSSRMLSGARSHHADLHRQMRDRHPRLFAARQANWRQSPAPLQMRLLLPLVARLPLSKLTRHRLYLLVAEPKHALRVRLARRRGAGGGDG